MRRCLSLVALLLAAAAPSPAAGPPPDKTAGPPAIASSGLLVCTGAVPVACGSVINDNNGNGASNAANYACGSNETGPELVYSLSVAAPTTVRIVLEPSGCDLDLFVLGSCDESDCIASSAGVTTEVVTAQLVAGTSYIVVDGYSGAVCDFELRVAGCTDRTVFRSELVETGMYLSLGIEHASLDVDGQDQPCVAYADSSGDIWYAVRSGGAWLAEPVDSSGTDFRLNPELVLGPAGAAHLAYLASVGGTMEIRYAKKVGAVWQVESLPVPGYTFGATFTFASLAVDALGNPHITYADDSGDLRYAHKNGGFWTTELIQASAGLRSAVRLDALGVPSVAFVGQSFGEIFFARRAGGAWVVDLIDSTAVQSFFPGGCALALDPAGAPHLLYVGSDGRARYAHPTAGFWNIETPGQALAYGRTSIAVDGNGTPHIAYNDASNSVPAPIWYGRRVNGSWVETLAAASPAAGNQTLGPALVLDSRGAPKIAYLDSWLFSLWLAEAEAPSFSVTGPAGGATWPVGSLQTVSWAGGLEEWFDARFDVSLSVDGGHTYQRLMSQARGESVTFRVPHAPTRYARMKVERLFPYEAAVSDSFFTIDASIAMTAFRAQRDEGGAVTVAWKTKPGPESDVSYRLERSDGVGAAFRGVHAGLLSVEEHTDHEAPPGASYRVVAVNGLGAEYVLGGTVSAGADADELLTARPLPFRGGELAVTFAAAGGLGGGAAPVVVQVFDVTGRRVRDVFRGEVPAGFHRTVWDGRDEGGNDVSPGIYFLRAESGGARATVKKIAVVR